MFEIVSGKVQGYDMQKPFAIINSIAVCGKDVNCTLKKRNRGICHVLMLAMMVKSVFW